MAESPSSSSPGERDTARYAEIAGRFLPDTALVLQHDGTISWVSDAVTTTLGYEPDELIGQNAFELLHPDDISQAADGFANILAFPGRLSPSVYRVRGAAGGWLPMEISGDFRFDHPGVEAMILSARDISHRTVLDAVLQAMAAGEPLAQALALLAAAMSHQLWEIDVAICFDGSDARRVAVGTTLPDELVGVLPAEETGPAPWHLAIAEGRPVSDHDLSCCGAALATLAREHGFTSCAVTPLPEFGGRTPACIIIWSRDSRLLGVASGWSLQVPLELAELALERRHHLSALEHAADHDPLTGLPNRRLFFAALELGGREPTVGRAVLYVDIDEFKSINDTHGHRIGDAVLVAMAGRLSAQLRPGDLLARLAGDEIGVFCPALVDPDDAVALATRLLEAVQEPILTDAGAIAAGVSIGVAVDPTGCLDSDALVDAADRALYRAKRAGRGQWALSG